MRCTVCRRDCKREEGERNFGNVRLTWVGDGRYAGTYPFDTHYPDLSMTEAEQEALCPECFDEIVNAIRKRRGIDD